jgi:hypothetical protein
VRRESSLPQPGDLLAERVLDSIPTLASIPGKSEKCNATESWTGSEDHPDTAQSDHNLRVRPNQPWRAW